MERSRKRLYNRVKTTSESEEPRTKIARTSNRVELFELSNGQRDDCGHPSHPKKPRMAVNLSSPHTMASRSVAQRLKQSSLKDNSLTAVASTSQVFKIPALVHKTAIPHAPLNQRDQNTIRVIAQYLRNLGLNESVETLVEESGCKVENSNAVRLREALLRGHWNDAISLLDNSYAFLKRFELEKAKLIILEEKFYDLLSKSEFTLALRLLREDFPDRKELALKRARMVNMLFMDPKQIGTLCPEVQNHRNKPLVWRKKLLSKVQRVLPASFMLPPRRMEQLIDQVWRHQVSRCKMHFSLQSDSVDPAALFVNHQCSKRSQPLYETNQVIKKHRTDVWCVEFSPDGKLVASGSKCTDIVIWEVDPHQSTLKTYQQLSYRSIHDGREPRPEDNLNISCMSWSSDSNYLVIAGPEQQILEFQATVFNVDTGAIHRIIRPGNPNCAFTSAAFFRGSSNLIAAANLRGQLQIFDISRPDPSNIALWEGYRIRCVYGMKDGKTVLAADTHNRLRLYQFEQHHTETLFTENSGISHFAVHPKEKYAVVTTKRHGLRIWDLHSRTLVRNLTGARQGDYTISASFGGPSYSYVASGSQDGRVVLWSMEDSRPIGKLNGHRGVVNAVSWSPRDVGLIVSSSDDKTVRVWTTNLVSGAQKVSKSEDIKTVVPSSRKNSGRKKHQSPIKKTNGKI